MICKICRDPIQSLNVINLEEIESSEGSRLLRIVFRKQYGLDFNDRTNFIYDKGTVFTIRGRKLKEFTGFGYKGYRCLQICKNCAYDVLQKHGLSYTLMSDRRYDRPSTLEARTLWKTIPPPPERDQQQTKMNIRTNHIRTALNRLVAEKQDGAFVIFEHPKSDKFVQFLSVQNELMCDVPLAELTLEEESGLKSLFFTDTEGAVNEGSYQTWFHVDDIDRAAELADWIFRDVFHLQESSTLTSEIFPSNG